MTVKVPVPVVAKRKPLVDDDGEIESDEEYSAPNSEERADISGSDSDFYEPTMKRRFLKGYNKYGTEDPILAAAEEALDNGLFDSEGNIDEEGFEGLFGTKFAESEIEESSSDPEKALNLTEDPSISEPVPQHILQDRASSAKTRELSGPSEESSELLPMIKKRAKGLLNRLSMSNFESIAVGLEALYKEYPRRLVTEAICSLVIEAVTLQSNMLESFVLVFASLTAALANLLGVPFIGHLLQVLSDGIDLAKNEAHDCTSEEERASASRKTMNLITLLAFLYDLQIVGSQLVGDLIREAVERLVELDTEVILRLVRLCGAQFRRDDPAMLKDIVMALGRRTQDIPVEAQGSRFRFMLEAIYDLKNNKQLKGAGLPSGELETTKKMLRGLVQSRGISKFEPMRLGLADLREAERRGRWWLVGGTWAPEASSARHAERRQLDSAQPIDAVGELARAQRMNTETRKRIFAALLASEDCVDAQQRLLTLHLTSKQERDIPAVVLHCVGQERAYNPFYALLAAKLVKMRHNHAVTFRHAFWDWLQQVEAVPLRRLAHLATFYASLVIQQALSLPTLLRRADLLHLDPQSALFFQLLLIRILQDSSEAGLHAIFAAFASATPKKSLADEVGATEETQAIRSSLKLFLVFYLRDKSMSELPPLVKDHAVLQARITLVAPYLE